MSEELAVVGSGGQLAVQALPLDAILRAAQDPGMDVAKMDALIGLYERMQDRAAKQAFDAALVACQAEMPRITKDAKVINHKTGAVQSRYATLERIDSIVREIYERHGFSVSYNTAPAENGKFVVTASVRHAGGHTEPYRIPLALDETGSKNATQGMGSVMSYGRRYLLCSIFNIITEGEDNDGQSKAEVPCITEHQALTIDTLLKDQNRDRNKFFAWVSDQAKATVTECKQIPASLHPAIMQALTVKK